MPEVSFAGTDVAPVIDIVPFFTGGEEAKRSVARNVARTCEETGFYLIEGHGFPPELIDRMVSVSRVFFALPEAEKLRVLAAGGPGYRPMASRQLGATREIATPPDLKEGFSIGVLLAYRSLDPQYITAPSARRWFATNIWPELPGFEEVWTQYFREMDALIAVLMRISALALELPERYFETACDRHVTHLNAMSYPVLSSPPLAGQFRAGPHSDYGGLTILWKDPGPRSLEVMDKSGQWQPVQPRPGCFIVNIGDLMARWTNDRWVSTLHRVVVPAEPALEAEGRLSMTYFFVPNYDAVIEAVETCVDADHPSRYEPITVGDYMAMKMAQQVARPIGA